MAIPKKRTSTSKKRIRKNIWKEKGNETALKTYSLERSYNSKGYTTFSYLTPNDIWSIKSYLREIKENKERKNQRRKENKNRKIMLKRARSKSKKEKKIGGINIYD